MTRPPLAIALLAALLLGAAGCSGEGSTKRQPGDSTDPNPRAAASPTPPAVSVHVRLEETAEADVAAAASAVADWLGIRTVVAGGTATVPDAPFILVDDREPAQAADLVVPTRYWGAFAGFWNEADELSFEDLGRALRGEVSDWADLGARPGRLTVYLPADLRPALETVFGALPPGDTAALRWLPLSEVAAQAAADAGSLALLPVDAADPRLRSLAVDGVDVVRGVGDAAASPLAERLWLRWEGSKAGVLAAGMAWSLRARDPAPIRLVATGDIVPARCVYARQQAYGDYRHAFLATADYLRVADLTAGSLDASLSDAGEPFGCTRTYNLLAPARSVEGLVHAGFDVVTVATNHAKNCGMSACGDRAFLDTLANLRTAGIEPVGGGENLAEARRPAVLAVRGVRFAFLGYDEVGSSFYGATEASPGTAPLDYGVTAEDVAAAQQEADVVVVMNHWGGEYSPNPTQRQMDLGQEAIDAGAALVVGNHAHVAQAVEWLDEGFVAYGLGNFVFDQDWSLETQQGVVLEATFHGPRLVGVRFLPVHVYDMHQPRWATADEAHAILQRMREASEIAAASR